MREAYQRVLGMIAAGYALPEVLDCLVRLVEEQSNGMLCSILTLDADGARMRHCAAPSLPEEYTRVIDGALIGPNHGSCGTAMYLGERVISRDIHLDPLWTDYRHIAERYGLRACWSTPILSPQRSVLGSFAMYYGAPRSPDDGELRLIESAANIASIAIEHQRSHQALRESEARNQAILRAIPDWMFLTTVEGAILDFHARDQTRLHVPPASFLGKRVTEVLPPPVGERLAGAFARVLGSDETETLEYTLNDGASDRHYEATIVRCGGDTVLSIVRDITDRKRAEIETDVQRRQLAHLSRVAMLGELTGTLAHELSQPLTAVRTNAQAARRLLARDPMDVAEVRAALDDIIRSNERAGAVIDRLRALLRKESHVFQPVDINGVVRDVIELMQSEMLSRRITLTTTLAPGLRPVLGDRVQLQQVVLNLVLNACDAMNATDPATRLLALSVEADEHVVTLAVTDNGQGIPEGRLQEVFEPFVTFREQGLGLGLAISRSIVSAHEGTIDAENRDGGGATFRCRFPLVAAEG